MSDEFDDLDFGGDPLIPFEDTVTNAHLADELLAYICPAGQAHTGSAPEEDHGHTQCMWIGLAIQRLRAIGDVETANVIDAAHLERQREFSLRTFGPGPRTKGALDHLGKELEEIRADPTDVNEWVDVIILAFDGAWRHGWEPQKTIDAIKAKQATNEARTWPDWRTMSEDVAIEHDRSGETSDLALRLADDEDRWTTQPGTTWWMIALPWFGIIFFLLLALAMAFDLDLSKDDCCRPPTTVQDYIGEIIDGET